MGAQGFVFVDTLAEANRRGVLVPEEGRNHASFPIYGMGFVPGGFIMGMSRLEPNIVSFPYGSANDGLPPTHRDPQTSFAHTTAASHGPPFAHDSTRLPHAGA